MLRFRRLLALGLVPALACLPLAAPTPTLAATTPAGGTATKTISAAETAATKAYWTQSRRNAARDASLIPLTGAKTTAAAASGSATTDSVVSGQAVGAVPVVLGALFKPGYPFDPYYAPTKSTGRLEFSYPDGTPSYCSASTIRSESRNDVLTAAHCLYTPYQPVTKHGNGWHSNFRFVPGTKNGSAPWGVWYPATVSVSSKFSIDGSNDQDVAFLSMQKLGAQLLYNVTGGPAFSANLPHDQDIMSLGYSWNFWGGGSLAYCSGTAHAGSVPDPAKRRDTLEVWSCRLTSGMSGGPVWLYNSYGSNPWTGSGGVVNGVQSAYIPGTSPTQVVSAYFGTDVINLFSTVRYL